MKKKTLLISLIIINVVIFIIPTMVFAQELPCPICGDGEETVDVVTLMLRVMQVALAIVDIFALFMFILGGFEFLISAGNPERVKKAKDTLVWATVGILVITLSYTVLKYIFEQVSKGFGA